MGAAAGNRVRSPTFFCSSSSSTDRVRQSTGTHFLHRPMALFGIDGLRQHASAFLRENVNRARLILTDVSHIQLLTEEATNADPWGPDIKTMAAISEAAFDFHEFERIVQVLRDRLDANMKRSWRQLDKTLYLLEYLLMHGPRSLSDEFRSSATSIEHLCNYNVIENGIDRGIPIRSKADRILEFLTKTDPRKDKENHSVHRIPMQQHVSFTNGKLESGISAMDQTGDVESQSLLFTSIYEEEKTKAVSRVDNHQMLFRQATSLSSKFVSNDGDFFHDDKSVLRTDSSSVLCKNFSSPACFRDISNLNLQQTNNANKKGCEIVTDVKRGVASVSQSNVTQTEHMSTRKFSGHCMSGNGSYGIDSKSLPEQQNMKLDARASNVSMSEIKQSAHKACRSKSQNHPLLPPPPKPGCRTRFKGQVQKENSTDVCIGSVQL